MEVTDQGGQTDTRLGRRDCTSEGGGMIQQNLHNRMRNEQINSNTFAGTQNSSV